MTEMWFAMLGMFLVGMFFKRVMERTKEFYGNGKRADSYANIAKMLKFTCFLVKETLDEIKE